MANSKQHYLAGMILSTLNELIFPSNKEKKNLNAKETFARCAMAIIGSFSTSGLADIIDPPTGPNHRNIGHSLALNTAGIAACTKLNKKIENQYGKALLKGSAIGAASHLVLDFSTPKGLPII